MKALALLAALLAAAPARALDYAQAVAAADAEIARQAPRVKNGDNLPFLLTHGSRTAKSLVFAHGLGDSPYYVRALAQIFFEHGYNVFGVLVPGHGTNPDDMKTVTLEQWRAAYDAGFAIARGLGDEVSVAGFSTGAALALDEVVRNDNGPSPARLGGAFLFSPALRIYKRKADWCVASAITTRVLPWAEGDPSQPEDDPHRYKRTAANGVCRLFELDEKLLLENGLLLRALSRNASPVFAAESLADVVVRPEAVTAFMAELPPALATRYVTFPAADQIAHASVPRPELNADWPRLESELRAFLARIGSPALAAPAPASVAARVPALESLPAASAARSF